ncbi:glycosyltransferase family 2 protein [Pseudonocardia spirodelae]|uniref:Glycosyltransferase family A protein n=1 Tax=Pseudonocardia spirodelae TaxID=3133431 RepID=A0ABU8T4I1_9PSEU
MAPRFSFLTTAHRTEHVIGATVRSVQAQTDPDWELVVVDNGPSDRMARTVRRLAAADPRIRLLRRENDGVVGGIRAAAGAARGRYLAQLNSDDLLHPRWAERLGGVLDARPEVTAVSCDAWRFDDVTGLPLPGSYDEVWGAARSGPDTALTLADLVERMCPYYTAAVRREAWPFTGLHQRDAVVTDMVVFLRLVTGGGTVVSLPERLAGYREASSSLSRGPHAELAVERARARVLAAFVERHGGPAEKAALDRERERSRYRQGVVGSRSALLDGDRAGARRAIREALRLRRDRRTLAVAAGVHLAPAIVGRLDRGYRDGTLARRFPAAVTGR